MRKIDEFKDEIIKDYQSGMGTVHISKKYGVPRTSLYSFLQKQGIVREVERTFEVPPDGFVEPQTVSFGGGVNSTAMLIGMRNLNIFPDAILFADTGGEKPETYEFIESFDEWLKKSGMPGITIVRYYESKHASLEQECLNNCTLPSKAFGFSGCSQKWKRYPMERWIKKWDKAIEAWKYGQKIITNIGIHAGETKRGNVPDTKYIRYKFPLKEWGWGQQECLKAINDAGLKPPCKSACFFCPSMRKCEIEELKHKHPDLYKRAIEMEENALEYGDLTTVKGLGRKFAWKDLVGEEDQAPMCDVCVDW